MEHLNDGRGMAADEAVNGGVIMRQSGGVKMHHGLGGSLSA